MDGIGRNREGYTEVYGTGVCGPMFVGGLDKCAREPAGSGHRPRAEARDGDDAGVEASAGRPAGVRQTAVMPLTPERIDEFAPKCSNPPWPEARDALP